MAAAVPLSLCKSPNFLIPSTCLGSSSFLRNAHVDPFKRSTEFRRYREKMNSREKRGIAYGMLLPVDPWAPNVDSQSIASQLFAFSLFPYIGFLYFITKSKSAPKLTLFGFYFLLAFVGATTKVRYGTSLSNVDWLHGGAESLLTLTNLFIVLGLREALRKAAGGKEKSTTNPGIKEDN